MDGLSSTAGAVAIAGVAAAAVALIAVIVLALWVRRLRADQRAILGDGERDLVSHAARLSHEFRSLHKYVQDAAARVEQRADGVEARVDHAIAYRALVRYDAYGEMSGRQSTSIALLDATGSGVVLSSIHHRDQARLYTKLLRGGHPDVQLSPEEEEAVRVALAGDAAATPDSGPLP